MSGPKIIDIEAVREVERRRIETLCARIEAATARHRAMADRSGQPAVAGESVSEELRRNAASANDVYRLIALRDQAKQQLLFVKGETSRMQKNAVEISARRRAADAAVKEEISRLLSTDLDDAARASLESAKNAKDSGERLRLYETAMQASDTDEAETESREAIAHWLAENEMDSVSGDYVAEELPARHPQRWRLEVERIRAETMILAEAVPGFSESIESSLKRIEAETNRDRRRLLLDDLRYPLADELRHAREAAKRAALIDEWKAALAVHAEDLDLAAWEARFAAGEEIQAEEVESAIDEAIAKASARTARREVLRTLQSLGYELRTGMETGFVVDGKIVLKKPNDLDYGVELSAMPKGGAGMIRTRVVRTRGQEAKTKDERLRDKEREESWCSDRSTMSEMLRQAGIECELKAQRAAGESPVAVINENAVDAGARRESKSDLRSRGR